MSFTPVYFFWKFLSMIGAVLRKNTADWVLMKFWIRIEQYTNWKKMKPQFIRQHERSCGKNFSCVRGITARGSVKKMVKIWNAISSGNVSLILPL